MTRQRVTITFTCLMDDLWGEPELWPTLTDDEIIELAHEDLTSLLDGAVVRVTREDLPV